MVRGKQRFKYRSKNDCLPEDLTCVRDDYNVVNLQEILLHRNILTS